MLRRPLLIALLATLMPAAWAIEPTPAITTNVVLKTGTSWDGTPLAYPAGQAEITGMLVEVAVGGETGWHAHPVPSFGMVLAGEFEVQLENGMRKVLRAGDAVAEVVGSLHNGRNIGTTPVKILVFYAGTAGTPLSVKH